MTDYTASRLGQVNGAGDSNALFLQVFSGEVLASFAEVHKTAGRHMTRTITNGKSASFPVIGRTGAAYHTPGTEITGGAIKHNEKVITINDLLLSSVFIPNIDEAKNHYDVRSIYSAELGNALARQWDAHVLQSMVQASLVDVPSVQGEDDRVGTVLTDADIGGSLSMAEDADTLIAGIYAASEALDDKFVAAEGRTIWLKPKQYNLLANGSKVLNVELGNAGNGSAASGRVLRVADMEVVKITNFPTANVTAGVGAGTAGRQAVDARNAVALVTHSSAVGTVKLLDLATEMEYQINRQGTLVVAKYAVGHGVVRPEAAVMLRTAAPA